MPELDEGLATTGPVSAKIVSKRAGTLVLLAIGVSNASNYAFQLIAGRTLGPEAYGLLGGLVSLMAIIGVSAGTLQTISAKAIAGSTAVGEPRMIDGLGKSALRISGLVALLCLALSPWLAGVLNVGVVPVLAVAIYVPVSTLGALAVGRLQGSQRFVAMAALSAGFAVAKLGSTIVALGASLGVTTIMYTMVGSVGLVAVLGLYSARSAGSCEGRLLDVETGRVFVAMTCYWALVSVDVVLAKNFFTPEVAGLYTAASVIGRATLWLPAVIAQMVFPKVTQAVSARVSTAPLMRNATAMSLVLSLAAAGGLILVGSRGFSIMYGEKFVGAAPIAWRLALASLPLALVNLFMHHHIARATRRFPYFVGAALVIQVLVIATFHSTPNQVVLGVGVVALALCIALVPRGAWNLLIGRPTHGGMAA